MIEELMGAYGGRLVIAVLGVAFGLVCLVGILWLLRGRSGPSPFVRGGRNRNPRLQVLDAAAVDTRRRLVLVRRDDVEHLIMIGGPTDIVVESGIRSNGPATRVAAEAQPAAPAPASPYESRGPNQARQTGASEPRGQAREQLRDAAFTENALREAALRQQPRPSTASVSAPPEPRPEPSASPRAAAPTLAAATAATPLVPTPIRSDASQPPQAVNANAAQAPRPAAPMATVSAAASLDDAANALDAVRGRVIQDKPEPPKIVPIGAASVPPALQQAAEKPKVLGSDFEQILEEEMANNLAAREATPAQPVQPAQRAEPRPAPITGAIADPSLQDEVARIFGEISVTRDK